MLEPEQQYLADEAVWAVERADPNRRRWGYEFARTGTEDHERLRRVCLYQGYLVAFRRPTPFSTEFAYEIAERLEGVHRAHDAAVAARKALGDHADG